MGFDTVLYANLIPIGPSNRLSSFSFAHRKELQWLSNLDNLRTTND